MASRRVATLEALINEQLKVELQAVLDRRDAVYERIAHCLELSNNMKMLSTQKLKALKTRVNLGCDFYVDASMCAPPDPRRPSRLRATLSSLALPRRPDTRWVYIDVGLGFHAQMTLEEAAQFGEAREARLMAQVEELSGRAAEVKAKIKIAVGAIDEVRTRAHTPFRHTAPIPSPPASFLVSKDRERRTAGVRLF
jgi:prefoldin subunit 5